MQESPPIVVIGRRETGADGSQNWTIVRSSSGGTSGIRDIEPEMISENPEAGMVLEITITIEKTDVATDEAKLVEAAAALIRAIARALDALRSRNASQVVSVNGVAISIGALIASILNTDYVVTDRSDASFANFGVGTASYSATGRHSDVISYRAIGGDPANPAAGYYGHPNFEGLGLLALVLHEAFHLTSAGEEWYADNYNAYRARHGGSAPFAGPNWEPYAKNTERLINQMALQAMAAVGQPSLPSLPPFADMQPPVDPATIP